MIALGITAALLTAVFATRVGVRAVFGGGEIALWLVVGVFSKRIRFEDKPGRRKKRAKKPAVEPTPEAVAEAAVKTEVPAEKEDKPGKKFSLGGFLGGYDRRKLIKLAFRFAVKAVRMPRVDLLEFNYCAGGARADKTALRYGKVCAALGVGLPFLNRALRIKKQKITANLDYTLSKPKISGKIQITFTLGAAAALLIWSLLEFKDCKIKEDNGNGKQTGNH